MAGKWNEHDHPRDDHGRFGHEHGGDTPNTGSHAGSGSERGMPEAVSTNTVKLSSGDTFAIDRHEDGGVTLTSGNDQVTYSPAETNRVMGDLANADDLDPGEHDTSTLGSRNLATIERTGRNAYTLQLEGGPPVELNGRDLDRINTANEKSSAASRIDTGNGDADLFVTDDNKIGLRHLGEDGTPVETRFDPKSWAKISRAMDVVIDRLDENEEFVKGDKADGVTSVTFRTNAGKARVELIGDWQGTNPGDRLEIMAVDESWGIVVDGPHQGAFGDAMQAIEDAGDNLGFYDRHLGSP